jgi:uncharacterized membrane protein
LGRRRRLFVGRRRRLWRRRRVGRLVMALNIFQRLLRAWRHRWHDERDAHRALPDAVVARITQRVAASEARHSGEVRICVEASLPLSYALSNVPTAQIVHERAINQFAKLRVWDTEANNGVLIYVQLLEKQIEIVADRGLNAKVSADQWQAVIERMRAAFRAARFEDGLTEALAEVSALLVAHFPLAEGQQNPNELPDGVVRR